MGLNLVKKQTRSKIEGDYPNGKWEKYTYDKNENVIKYEASDGFWIKCEYNDKNLIYYENSYNYWYKNEYDNNGNMIYFEDSDDYWQRREYDNDGNEIYIEESEDGVILDDRKNI